MMDAVASTTQRLAAARQAPCCALTGLPLLADFLAMLYSHIEQAENAGQSLALMVIDIDHFTVLNHALGHHRADALLLAVASSLRLGLPPAAVLGRLAGDTFVALLPGVGAPGAAVQAARRLQLDLVGLQPLALAECDDGSAGLASQGVTCSIGISLVPEQGTSADQVLRQAESAMYLARAGGRSGVEVFCTDQAQAQAVVERRMVMLDMPGALKHGELELRYQPQFAVATGRLVGVEALLRWRHPRYGLVMPNRFIAAAEACGLIDDIGAWVLREACAQARRWRDVGMPAVPMAVNVSAKQLLKDSFWQDVQDALNSAGLPADQLELEITESALVSQPERAIALLTHCRQQGLRISLDDFGTGHANLSTLLRLPVDQIKIDCGFIAAVPHDSRCTAVVRALIHMAHALNIGVVAEGVETKAQLAFLRAEGCAKLQGHLYAEALEPWVFEVQHWDGTASALARSAVRLPNWPPDHGP